jgi:hypothetical protein
MAIVLTLPDEFQIENYEGLQTFLTNHLQLDQDTVEQLPNLIRLAEIRLNRLVLAPERETTLPLATAAGVQYVAQPSDFRQARQLKIDGDGGYPLEAVTLNVVETYDYPGKPVAYAVSGNNFLFGPVPDAVYSLTLTYLAKLAPLNSNTQTNWLLTENAGAYVYMAAAVIEKHRNSQDSAALYLSLAEAAVAEINAQGNRKRNAGPIRLRSPVVV